MLPFTPLTRHVLPPTQSSGVLPTIMLDPEGIKGAVIVDTAAGTPPVNTTVVFKLSPERSASP